MKHTSNRRAVSLPRIVLPLCALAALAGLWLGVRSAPWDESQAIVAVVDRYVSEAGGQATDCVAIPGQGVWLEVICDLARYTVTRDGRITRQGPST